MSLAAIEWALREPDVQRTVFGTARHLLFVMADHANRDTAEVSISRETMVAESGLSDGAVGAALRRLEQLGLVESIGYRHRARVRRLAVPDVTSAPHADVTSAPHADDAPTSARRQHDVSTTSAGDADKPEPEPEPRSSEIPSSSTARGEGYVQHHHLEDLTPDAQTFALDLAALAVVGAPGDGELGDAADIAEYGQQHKQYAHITAAQFWDATKDKRSLSRMRDRAPLIFAEAVARAEPGGGW